MNAYKFVAEKGIEEARKLIEFAGPFYLKSFTVKNKEIDADQLKQAIADFELIEKVGGLDVAKKQVKQAHEQGYLTISVWMKIRKENNEYEGFGCLYIDKLEAAITRIEEGLRDEL